MRGAEIWEKILKGKELGKGISQESTGLYSARFVDRFGKRKHKRFKKLQECRAWIADATYVDEHSDISMPSDMLVNQWFDYWIGDKKENSPFKYCSQLYGEIY